MFLEKNPSQYSFFKPKLIWLDKADSNYVENQPDFLYSGLSNTIGSLENEMMNGKKEERDRLKRLRESCTENMKQLKEPITIPAEFIMSAKNLELIRSSIEKLKSKDITLQQLRGILISNSLGGFVDALLDGMISSTDFGETETILKVRETITTTSEPSPINLLNTASAELINMVKSSLIETKGIIEGKLENHLNEKFNLANERLENLQKAKPPRLEPKTLDLLNGQLAQFKEFEMNSEKLSSLTESELTALLDEIETLNHDLEVLDLEPDTTETLSAKIDKLSLTFEGITDDQIEALIEKRRALTGEYSHIGLARQIENARDLRKLPNEYSKIKKNLEAGKLDADERMQLQLDLNAQLEQFEGLNLSEKIDQNLHPEKITDAQRARSVITELKGETDVEKIKEIFSRHFAEGKIDWVNDDGFEHYEDLDGKEHNLKEFTGGEMVFYEHGAHWKIVINEEELAKKGVTDSFRNQITHELLHVEFENSELIKNHWVEKYTKNKDWNKIKKAFVERFPNKRPPGFIGPMNRKGFMPHNWPDAAVVSELYAMGAHKEDNDTHLNEVISKAGVSGIEPIFLGAEEESKDEIIDTKKETDDSGTSTDSEGGVALEIGSHSGFKEEIEGCNKTINDYIDSSYISYVPGMSSLLATMKDFNKETGELNDAVRENMTGFASEAIKERIEKIKGDLEKIKNEIEKVSENIPNDKISFVRKLWNETSFLSVMDIFQMGVNFKESLARRSKRRVEDHAARLGMAVFEKIPFLSDFASEASAKKEKAEADEVGEWEGNLQKKDAPYLYEMLRKMSKKIDPDKYQFKAILRVLAEKGRLDWRNESIWKLLSKLQNATYISVNDDLIKKNYNILRSKIKTAMSDIWDKDEFLSLESKNGSSYTSKKESYNPQIEKSTATIGPQLEALYTKFISGKKGEVDPMEYEALIEYAITNGRFNAEKSMFYLLAGMGLGILTPDRGEALDGKSSTFPPLDWFAMSSECKTTEDWRKLCKDKFGDEFKKGSLNDGHSSFQNYYFTEILNSFGTQQRIRKSVDGDKKWDPDWCRAIASGGNANVMKIHMSGTSGRVQLKDKHAENTIAGLLQWFEENARLGGLQTGWKNHFMDRMASFAMSQAIYSGVAYPTDKNFFRVKSIFSNIPGEDKSTNHPGVTVGVLNKKMESFADQFDDGFSQFINLITDTNKADENKGETLLAEIKTLLSRYPMLTGMVGELNNLDKVFNSLDTIVKGILSTVPDKVFLDRISNLKAGI